MTTLKTENLLISSNPLSMGELYDSFFALIVELTDAVDFMKTMEVPGKPQFIGCVCDAEEEEHCTCENEEGRHQRVVTKENTLEQAREDLKRLKNTMIEVHKNGESDDSYRICSDCKEIMTEGYVIDNGLDYYCSDTCLEKNMSRKEFNKLYNDGEGDSYWTNWEI